MNTVSVRVRAAVCSTSYPSSNLRKIHTTASRHRTVPVYSRFGGGSLLDRPSVVELPKTSGWDTSKDSSTGTGNAPQTDTGNGSTDKSRNNNLGGGKYRVLLVNSPKHTETGVVKALTAVVQGIAEDHAKNCFQTSKTLGQAIVVSTMREIAEFYQQQLYRYGCKVAVEPDTTVL